MLCDRRDNNVNAALKRLLTLMVILSWTHISKVVVPVNASSPNNGGSGGGWFNKVFPGGNNNNPNGYPNDGGSFMNAPPLPPGGPFTPPPPPPPMGQPQQQQGVAPPPPMAQNLPPPPPPSGENGVKKSEKGSDDQNHGSKLQQQQQQEVSWDSTHMPPPPQQPGFDGSWQNQQMQQPPPQQQQQQWMDHDQSIRELQYDIDNLLNHQHDLYAQINNLTSSLMDMEHSSESQMSQIDLLLEQVADAEAYASAESNAALEYKTNCTNLGNTIETLKSSIQNWEAQCKELTEGQKCDQEEIRELKEKLKSKERELENLACGIEMARLEKQKDAYEAAYERKKRQKKTSFFAWLFGWDSDEDAEDESDEDLEKLQNLARSTLLNALQSERNNVEELENALSKTQQNNSAIAEMVASRDSLIDELNDRVAVFEEDKVVLKAALRQLQKEMKEEAPKTQKLISELKSANNKVKKLETDIKGLNDDHTAKIESLNKKLDEKDNLMNETDSKMQMISVYVDQLEERLASFAVARRDIQNREKACDTLVEKNVAMEEELTSIKQEAEDTKNERDEMKNLVDLLVEERTLLQEEKQKLNGEKEKLIFGNNAIKEELDLLNDSFLQLEAESTSLKEKLEQAEASVLEQEMELNMMKTLNDESDAKLAEQEVLIEKSVTVTMSLQEDIQKLLGQKETAALRILSLEQKVQDLVAEAEAKAQEDAARLAEEEERRLLAEEEEAARQEEERMTLLVQEEEAARQIEEEEERIEVKEEIEPIIEEVTVSEVVEEVSVELEEIVEERVELGEKYEESTPGKDEGHLSRGLDLDSFEVADETALDDTDTIQDFEVDDRTDDLEPDQQIDVSTDDIDGYSFATREIIVDHVPSADETIKPLEESDGITADETGQDTIESELEMFDDEEIPFEAYAENESETTKTREISINDINIGDKIENEPPLPGTYPPKLPPNAAFAQKRLVPLRGLRKQFSKMTGIHGFFTEPSGTNMKRK